MSTGISIVKSGGSAPTPTPVGATLMKTGQTNSHRTGDDGDLEAGRATDFFTLASNNPFGNTNRFTDELGGQTYTNNIVIDWSTYNGSNVLGYYRIFTLKDNWNTGIDDALLLSVGTFTTGWRLSNFTEAINIFNLGINLRLNYSPFNFNGNSIFMCSTSISTSTAAYHCLVDGNLFSNALVTSRAKTSNAYVIYCRTFTVTGTTLT